jgi:hypothetical protein
MTRKDYIIIAESLKEALESAHDWDTRNVTAGNPASHAAGVLFAANRIASRLATDNPRFNHAHFLAVVRGEKELKSRPE